MRKDKVLRLPLFFLLSGISILFTGCFSHRGQINVSQQSSIVWPVAPAETRIRYLYSFHSPTDLGMKNGFVAWLTGAQKPPELRQPVAIAIGKDETIYVVDIAGSLYSFRLNAGKFKQQRETVAGNLGTPVGLTIGAHDSVYVIDASTRRVIVYSSSLVAVREFDTGLQLPAGIVWDAKENQLWIADAKRNQIGRFDLSGKMNFRFGDDGDTTRRLNTPTHLWLDSTGLYVSDAFNFRVQLYTRDGKYCRSFGKLGSNPGALARPKGIATDSDGNLYVVDALFGNVQLFDRDGRLLLFFGTTGSLAPGSFNLPNGIFIDTKDRIYIADTHHSCVQVFQYVTKSDSSRKK